MEFKSEQSESNMFLEDLIKKVTHLHENHLLQTPAFLATLREKEAKHKV